MNLKQINENGRSMVEMLGVMAIVGVLSITGIYGYTKAMERHRANELLNEAAKRAMLIAGQIASAGEVPETLTDNEDSSGHTYAVKKNGNNQFTLGISGVDDETCELMQQMIGGAIQAIDCSDNSAALTFNNDLSTEGVEENSKGTPKRVPMITIKKVVRKRDINIVQIIPVSQKRKPAHKKFVKRFWTVEI